MIISFITGGLGNQMFQFAAGKALALKTKKQLKLDTSYYSLYQTNRTYELSKVFKSNFSIVKQAELKKLLGWPIILHKHSFLRKLYRRLPFCDSWITEPTPNHWQGFSEINKSCLIEGNWQSADYFNDYSNEIRQAFEFDMSEFKHNELINKIKLKNSVSIHIRRGDYISNQKTLQYHGICEESYYLEAIEYIKQKIENPKFYIFSDDLLAARKTLKNHSNSCYFVEENSTSNNHFDMMLMSKCNHNIIANSSFSWWAAWLNNNSNKIVIAPKQWFNEDISDQDLIPKTWIRL